MKARTLKISLLVCLGAFLSVKMFAQPAGFQQHGNNSLGATVASENIDSITTGATAMRYVVAPDPAANPAYTFATMSGTLASTFNWTVTGVGSINGAPDTDNDINITAGAAGSTGTIEVVETSGACPSGITTSINVAVIAAPTAVFDDATNAICQADIADYPVNITLSTATANGRMRVIVNMDGPATAGIYTTTLNVSDATTSFTIPAAEFDDGLGDYEITYTEISDHISRKSNFTVSTAGLSHVLTINRTPSTGNIYHIPNL